MTYWNIFAFKDCNNKSVQFILNRNLIAKWISFRIWFYQNYNAVI